jgi:AcrR family transcriptional regulator
MPKLIDHSARKREIAAAAWRVVVRRGVRGLSVRNVAQEAGLATASLRRAFPTQQSLVAYCMELIEERVRERITATPHQACFRDLVELHLREFLPLDRERRTEMEVFLVLGAAALSDPALRRVYDRVNDGLAEACRAYVRGLVDTHEAPGDTDVVREAAHLHALIDGLALHLVQQPADADPSWATRVLGAHLDRLLR